MNRSHSKQPHYSGLVILSGCLLWSVWAQAGPLQVSPLRLTLSTTQPIDAITVHNDDAHPTVVQVQAVAWSQEAGSDLYIPTTEILATPPIFTLPPGGSQIVRVGVRRPIPQQHELSYRLYFQEVLSSFKPNGQGLRMALRLGVPVFLLPAVPVSSVLRWQANRMSSNAIRLDLHNAGNTHVQVASLQLSTAQSDHPLATQTVSTYLLPGQTQSWFLLPSSPLPGTQVRLTAQTNRGEVYADLVVGEP